MNERINALIEQCEDYGSWDNKTYSFDKEKFAQLIGRECLSLADDMRDNLDGDGEKQQALGAAWVGLAIARHFGVE